MRFLHCIHGQSHCYHVEYGGNNYDTAGEYYFVHLYAGDQQRAHLLQEVF